MTSQDMQTSSLDDIPDSNGAVVASRDAVLSVSGDGSNGVGVTLEAVVVERVLVRKDWIVVLLGTMRLEENESKKGSSQRKGKTEERDAKR